jgi:replicative DNA helicase Mcm
MMSGKSSRHALRHDREPLAFLDKEKMFECTTEILTLRGWERVDAVQSGDSLATLTTSNTLEYHPCRAVSAIHYPGQMYRLRSRGVDLMVTPDHQLYVSRASSWTAAKPYKKIDYPMGLRQIRELLGRRKRFQKWAEWSGEQLTDIFYIAERRTSSSWHYKTIKVYPSIPIPMCAWLDFLGWYVAEGWTINNGSTIKVAYNYHDAVEIKQVADTIKGIGCKARKAEACFVFHKTQIGLWLNANCGRRSNEKHIPDFIRHLPPDLIRVFLSSLFLGDAGKSKTSYILASVSRRLIDEVQVLLLKIGAASRVEKSVPPGQSARAKGRYPVHFVNWMKESRYIQTSKPGSKVFREELVPYDGQAVAFDVPNDIVFVRRNGIPVWCGAR